MARFRWALVPVIALLFFLVAVPAQANPWLSLAAGLGELVAPALKGVFSSAADIMAQVREATDLTKAAYEGIHDVTHLSGEQLGHDAKRALFRNSPEAQSIYRDVKSIQDLERRNPERIRSLEEALYARVYGPAAGYLPQQTGNMGAVAASYEMQERHQAMAVANGTDIAHLTNECEKGEGACLVAAQHAAFAQSRILMEIHEVGLAQVDLQRRMLMAHDSEAIAQYDTHIRASDEILNQAAELAGIDLDALEVCQHGECPYQRYGDTPYARLRFSNRDATGGGLNSEAAGPLRGDKPRQSRFSSHGVSR